MDRKFRKAVRSVIALTTVSALMAGSGIDSVAYSSKGNEVVSFAESTIGVISGRPNVVTDFYDAVGEWCAMFIQYCAAMVGAGDKVPYSSYCDSQEGFPGGVDFFRSKNRFFPRASSGYHPQRSDVIYYDWNLDGYADHVGYVSGADSENVYTVEGNVDDSVQACSHSLNDVNIMGYGVPDYDGTGILDTGTPSPGAAVTTPDVWVGGAEYTVISPVGAWVRWNCSFDDNKIDVVSTGTVLYSSMTSGEWVYFDSIPIEGCSVNQSGWINISTLSGGNVSSVPSVPDNTGYDTSDIVLYTCTIGSPVGAWLRSSCEFSDFNKLGILDTYQYVDVYAEYGEWLRAGAYVNGSYTMGYVHSSTISGNYTDNTTDTGTSYYVTSPIGCNFRSDPEIADNNILAVLDAYQSVEVISIYGEWAFAITYVYGYPMYGYVHTSAIG